MGNTFRYSDLDDENSPRPGNFEFFDKALERIGREHNVKLRLVWQPDRQRKEMVGWRGAKGGYIGKVYAQNPLCKVTEHLGWWVCKSKAGTEINIPDGNKVVRHAQPLELPDHLERHSRKVHWDEKTGLWWIPDWLVEEVAYNRWQIEERASDREREEYEKCSFDPVSLELVRELGPFPDEGLWVPLGPMLAEHNPLCCDEANREGALCPGRYRPPNERDLDWIRGAIQARNAAGLWNGLDGDNSKATHARYQEREEAARARALALRQFYREIIGNNMAPVYTKLTPKVIGGVGTPQHVRPIGPDDIVSIN